MNQKWIKKCVWLCLIAISNPVVFANAMIHLGPNSMNSPPSEMVMDQAPNHDHSAGMSSSHHEMQQSEEVDCCIDHCDCGVLGCRVQSGSLNTLSFQVSRFRDSFETSQNHYALNFPSGLYRPPATPL